MYKRDNQVRMSGNAAKNPWIGFGNRIKGFLFLGCRTLIELIGWCEAFPVRQPNGDARGLRKPNWTRQTIWAISMFCMRFAPVASAPISHSFYLCFMRYFSADSAQLVTIRQCRLRSEIWRCLFVSCFLAWFRFIFGTLSTTFLASYQFISANRREGMWNPPMTRVGPAPRTNRIKSVSPHFRIQK